MLGLVGRCWKGIGPWHQTVEDTAFLEVVAAVVPELEMFDSTKKGTQGTARKGIPVRVCQVQ